MKKRLIIIGNGFDLHHHMKTHYINYRQYLLDSGNDDIVNCFELSLEGDCDEQLVNMLWSRMEESIAMLPYEQAYQYLKSYLDENWSDSYHHDFPYEVEKMAGYWPGIKDNLAKWIETIEYTKPFENLFKVINTNSNYISFNYTNTLERLYKIPKYDICYIHGDYSKDEELVLGHRNESYYPEWDDSNIDEDIRLLNAGSFMECFRVKTLKPVETICKNNTKYLHFINDFYYSEIYMLGLSYNDIDQVYMEKISANQNARWFFCYYNDDDKNKIPQYASDIGVRNYEMITYSKI